MQQRCPTPHKVQFPSEEHADNALGHAWQNMRGGYLPRRAYLCPCGLWHLTHKPLRAAA